MEVKEPNLYSIHYTTIHYKLYKLLTVSVV